MIPDADGKSLAPALEAGLDIMEFLAVRREAGFNQLCKLLPMSKASVSRILKTLAARGYVRKDQGDGRWCRGPRMGMLGMAAPVAEALRAEAPKVLKSFVDAVGDTALCVYWSGEEFQVVAKEQREGGIVMMDVGAIARDLSRYPWGWLFFLSLDEAGRRKAMARLDDPELLSRRIDAWAAHINEKGFAFDDHEIYHNRMRFAAPVRDVGGRVVGAIGASGTKLSIPDGKLDAFGAELIRHADMLSERLSQLRSAEL